jgi:hypothetical protein
LVEAAGIDKEQLSASVGCDITALTNESRSARRRLNSAGVRQVGLIFRPSCASSGTS